MSVSTPPSLLQRVVEFLAPYEEKTLLTFYKYFVVDSALRRNGQEELYWSKKKLLDLINSRTSRFSAERDIADRRFRYLLIEMIDLFDAPIKHRKGAGKGYYYTQPDYSLATAILQNQKQELLPGSHILVGMLDFLNQFSEVIPNVPDYERLTTQLTGRGTVGHQIIQFDVNNKVEGLEWIKPCYKAIQEHQPLIIIYRPYGKEKSDFLLHPYQLRESRQRWFVWGWNHQLNNVSILGLDRILDIRPTTLVQYDISHLNLFLTNFESILGITFPSEKNLQPSLIKVRVSRRMSYYLNSKPIHSSQRRLEIDENENTLFSFRLIPNFEFEQWVLGLGEEVCVIEPLTMVHRIQQRIQRMASLYTRLRPEET